MGVRCVAECAAGAVNPRATEPRLWAPTHTGEPLPPCCPCGCPRAEHPGPCPLT